MDNFFDLMGMSLIRTGAVLFINKLKDNIISKNTARQHEFDREQNRLYREALINRIDKQFEKQKEIEAFKKLEGLSDAPLTNIMDELISNDGKLIKLGVFFIKSCQSEKYEGVVDSLFDNFIEVLTNFINNDFRRRLYFFKQHILSVQKDKTICDCDGIHKYTE